MYRKERVIKSYPLTEKRFRFLKFSEDRDLLLNLEKRLVYFYDLYKKLNIKRKYYFWIGYLSEINLDRLFFFIPDLSKSFYMCQERFYKKEENFEFNHKYMFLYEKRNLFLYLINPDDWKNFQYNNFVIITEGLFDGLFLSLIYPYVYISFGLVDIQPFLLKITNNFLIAFDNDEAGREYFYRLKEKYFSFNLQNLFYILKMYDKKDFGEFLEEGSIELVNDIKKVISDIVERR